MTDKDRLIEDYRLKIDDFLGDEPNLIAPFNPEHRDNITTAIATAIYLRHSAKDCSWEQRAGEELHADKALAKVRLSYFVAEDEFDVGKIGRGQKKAFDALIDGVNHHIMDMEISDIQLSDHDKCLKAAGIMFGSFALLGAGRG